MEARFLPLARCAVVLLGLFSQASVCASNEIAVVVASDAPAPAVTPRLLRDIYLKNVLLNDDGTPYIPVNLPPDSPLRLSLAETLFNKSAEQLQDYWNQRYFQGITPPYVLDSQEAVVRFVTKTPGAIGYIAACSVDLRIKQVLTLSAAPSQRAALAQLCLPDAEMRPSE